MKLSFEGKTAEELFRVNAKLTVNDAAHLLARLEHSGDATKPLPQNGYSAGIVKKHRRFIESHLGSSTPSALTSAVLTQGPRLQLLTGALFEWLSTTKHAALVPAGLVVTNGYAVVSAPPMTMWAGTVPEAEDRNLAAAEIVRLRAALERSEAQRKRSQKKLVPLAKAARKAHRDHVRAGRKGGKGPVGR